MRNEAGRDDGTWSTDRWQRQISVAQLGNSPAHARSHAKSRGIFDFGGNHYPVLNLANDG